MLPLFISVAPFNINPPDSVKARLMALLLNPSSETSSGFGVSKLELLQFERCTRTPVITSTTLNSSLISIPPCISFTWQSRRVSREGEIVFSSSVPLAAVNETLVVVGQGPGVVTAAEPPSV